MGIYGDEYLAHSAGFADGRLIGTARGVVAGRRQGYNEGYNDGFDDGKRKGWEDAVLKANIQIDAANEEIAKLRLQLKDQKLKAAIVESVSTVAGNAARRAQEQRDLEVAQRDQLQREQAQSLRAEHEQMHKAFLGVISIATPMMKVFAKLPLDEKEELIKEYGKLAIQLQSAGYIDNNRYPHNQLLIKRYAPIVTQVLSEAAEKIRQKRAWRKQQEEYQGKCGAARLPIVTEGT